MHPRHRYFQITSPSKKSKSVSCQKVAKLCQTAAYERIAMNHGLVLQILVVQYCNILSWSVNEGYPGYPCTAIWHWCDLRKPRVQQYAQHEHPCSCSLSAQTLLAKCCFQATDPKVKPRQQPLQLPDCIRLLDLISESLPKPELCTFMKCNICPRLPAKEFYHVCFPRASQKKVHSACDLLLAGT